MSGILGEYGIWGGRFQIIHIGHEFVLKYVSEHYLNVCIGIVNPIPSCPPCDIKEHDKFLVDKNPLSYFERVYLWDILLKHHNIDAVIVPHWHPRKSLALEWTFLPQPKNKRTWIIPNLIGEDVKILDFEKADETVEVLEIPADIKLIHSSELRRFFNEKYIPETIRNETKNIVNDGEISQKYIIVPILGDDINPLLLCGGIQLSFDKGCSIIFSPVVKVGKDEIWWNSRSIDDDYFTFYQKHEIINKLMHEVEFYDFLVIPFIVQNDLCNSEIIASFFPKQKYRSWLFLDGINCSPHGISHDKIFKDFRFEEIIRIKQSLIPNSYFLDISCLKSKLFLQMNYPYSYEKKERKDENSMPKYDFRNATIHGDVVDGDKNTTYYNTLCNKDLSGLLDELLKTKDIHNYETLFSYADEKAKSMSKEEQKKTVEDSVKKHIDTESKRDGFLKKIKEAPFDITKSVIGGLILHAIKTLIFGV